MKNFIYFLLMLIGIYVFINIFMVPAIEQKILYIPSRRIVSYPDSLGIKYEDVYLNAKDGVKINGWFIRNKLSKKVILLFHGNGGNISCCLNLIKKLYEIPSNIFIIDYHGYGKSEGMPSEKNLYIDAETAYDYLIFNRKINPDQIIIFGVSFGGAVAADLAVKKRAKALILQSTFTSASGMATRINPLYRKTFVWIRSKFDVLEKVKRIKIPLLVLHSKNDEVIPYKMSQEIYDKARNPKSIYLFKGYKHDDIIFSDKYLKIIKSFYRK